MYMNYGCLLHETGYSDFNNNQFQTINTTFAASQPDFSMSASPTFLSIPQGGSASTTITTAILASYANSVSLAVSGLPAGASAVFSPTVIASPGAGSSTMMVTTGSGTPTGTYSLTITGTGGGTTHSATVSLVVTSEGSALFYDGFESGGYSGWTAEAGSYVRSVTTTSPAAGSYSYTQAGGSGAPRDGVSHVLGGIIPTEIAFYAKTSTTAGATAYFVAGDDNVETNKGIIFFSFNAGTLGVYNGSSWVTGGAYSANTWYLIQFKNINWNSKTFDFYVNGVLQTGSVPFRSQATTSLTELHLYNFDYAQAWYDEIVMTGPSALPVVTGTAPASGATGVPVTSSVTATFGEAVDSSTITSSSFILTDAAENIVSGTVSYDAASFTAFLKPAAALAYGSTYTASISTEVKDLAGKSLATVKKWAFTTLIPTNSLIITIEGSGTGSVTSTPSGIACTTGNSGVCFYPFTSNSTVSLTSAAGATSQFNIWSGACSGSVAECRINMDADKSVIANFIIAAPARITGSTPTYYNSLADAYAAISGSGSIQAIQSGFQEELILNRGVTLLLQGGYDPAYTSNTGTYSTLEGTLTVVDGNVTIEGFVIQ